MTMFNYESDELYQMARGETNPSSPVYVSDCKKEILTEVSPNYPKLTDYEKEWMYFAKNDYAAGTPVPLEYLEVQTYDKATVENVIPYAYKRAVLKGNTLVNLLNKLTVNGEVGQTTEWYTTTYTTGTVKSGTYILLYHVKETSGTTFRNTPGIKLADGTYQYHGYENFNATTGIKKWIFTVEQEMIGFGYWLTYNTGKVVVEDFILLEYQEGMEYWDIPYFEGMQSVQMPVLTTSNGNGIKTNILTVNEPVELRGVDNAQDEMNLLNGELTERVGKVVLDGSENWSVNNSDNEGFYSASTSTYIGKPNGGIISDKLPKTLSTKSEGVMMGLTTGKVMVSFNRESSGVTNLTSFKEKLALNPITIQYELEKETVKTVDLSGTIKPYEGTNHYTVSSNTIPPQLLLVVPIESTGNKTLNDINTEE